MPSSLQRGAIAALVITIFVWGYSWVVMKQVLAWSGPFHFATLRYLIGAGVLFLALLATRQSLKPPPLGPTLLIGLAQTTAFQGLEQLALLHGGAGRVALLAYSMPFWTVLAAWLVLTERPQGRHWLGLAFAGAGLVLIIEPWHGLHLDASTLLALSGGATWALGTVFSKRLFQRHAVSALTLTAWQMLLGALALGAIATVVDERAITWNLPFLAGLAYSAVLASALAWWLWSVVLKRLPTTVATVTSLGVPVVSVLIAWPLMAERPSLAEALGIVLVLAGLVAVSGLGPRRRHQH